MAYVRAIIVLSIITTCMSLHIFVSSDTTSLHTRQTFNIVIHGGDCTYEPCHYTAFSGAYKVAGIYHNNIGIESVPFVITEPGTHTIYVTFRDTDDTSTNFVSLLTPTFVLSVEVLLSEQCNSVRLVDYSGKVVDSVRFNRTAESVTNSENKVELSLVSDEGYDMSKYYFHIGVEPLVTLRNGSTSYQGTTQYNDKGSWSLNLTSAYLLNPALQSDWELTISMPPLESMSCTVRSKSLIISFFSDLFTSPVTYFGNSVNPEYNSKILSHRQSPCSKNLIIIFQELSKYIGITTDNGESVSWHKLQNFKNVETTSNSYILDMILLPNQVVIVTNNDIITMSPDETNIISINMTLEPTSASITSPVHCPTFSMDNIVITFNNNYVVKSKYPYTNWENMTLETQSDDASCTANNTYSDPIRQLMITTYSCEGNIITVNISKVSGVHWHMYTSYMYVYGSEVLFSSTRGSSFSTVLRLPGDDQVLYMSSCPNSGDIVAVTKHDKLYLSNVGVTRFVELQNIQDTPFTQDLKFYSFQQTSQLNIYILNSTEIHRFGLPTRSIIREGGRTHPLMFEVVGRNLVQIVAHGQSDFFREVDIGKTFRVKDGGGAGIIDSVEYITSDGVVSSAATLTVTEMFVKAKSLVSQLLIEIVDDEIFVSLSGDSWKSNSVGQCINVLMCTPFIIDDFHNETTVKVSALHPNRVTYCSGKIASNRWILVNLNHYTSEIALAWNEKLTVKSTSMTGVFLETSEGSLETFDILGKIITLNKDKHGIVLATSGGTMTVSTNYTFNVDDVFNSWEVKFHSPGVGMLSEFPRITHWSISEDTCTTTFVDKYLNNVTNPVDNSIRYIDTYKSEELTVRISNTRPMQIKFNTMFDNRDILDFTSKTNSTSHITQITLNITHDSTEGGTYSAVSITPRDMSLKCEVPSVLYTVFKDCSPLTRLSVKYPHISSSADFLQDTLYYPGSEGDAILTHLPVNYRPPSSEGIEISTSPNIYNVDPNATVLRNSSEKSHVLKQCAGVESVAECRCTPAQRVSDMEADSDCRQIVYTLSYSEKFIPELYLNEFGKEPTPLNNSYVIEEVNNRKEFEIYENHGREQNRSTDDTCNYRNCSIVFLGSELYHFRVTVINDTICNYTAEFIIYVVNVPLSTTLKNILTVWVGLIVILIILIYYVMFSTKSAERDQAFNVDKTLRHSPRGSAVMS